MHEHAFDAAKDLKAAAWWYGAAADAGNAQAAYKLALLYQISIDGPADAVRRTKWLQRAAEQGTGEAV